MALRPRHAPLILAVLGILAGPAVSAGQEMAIGPVPIEFRFRDVRLPATVAVQGKVGSTLGVLSADGFLDMTFERKDLVDLLQSLARSSLPQVIPTSSCVVRLTGLDIDQLEVVANELRIGVQAHLQIERCVSARLDAHIMLPVVPQRIDARTIQLAIPRNPVIDLPLSWRIISNLFVGDLRTVLRQKLESVLRTEPRARLVIPTSPGVRAAFQGASVKGSGNSVVLHVVGDVHVEDSVFTALLVTRWNPLAIDLESIR